MIDVGFVIISYLISKKKHIHTYVYTFPLWKFGPVHTMRGNTLGSLSDIPQIIGMRCFLLSNCIINIISLSLIPNITDTGLRNP